jgi:hypothetical protein
MKALDATYEATIDCLQKQMEGDQLQHASQISQLQQQLHAITTSHTTTQSNLPVETAPQ